MKDYRVTSVIRLITLSCALLLITALADGQEIENRFQARTYVDLSKKITKKLQVELTPELRWEDGFALDRFQLNSKLEYKFASFFSVAACYRFIGNLRTEQSTEYLHRYQFNLSFQPDIKRWEPGFRLSYTNYTDDTEGKKFLRYKAFLAYDIPGCKITPEAGFEIYHKLDDHTIYKFRYKAGLEYKLSKKIRIAADYKLDYYMTQYRNRHIAELGLKYRF